MNARDERLSELLEEYFQALESDPNAALPRALAESEGFLESEGLLESEGFQHMMGTAQKMHAHFHAPEPNAGFTASLREQLEREATRLARTNPKNSARRLFTFPRWLAAGVGAALVIALLTLAFLATRPTSVNAEELLGHARTAASDLQGVNVKSFEMKQTSFDLYVDDPNSTVTRAAQGETKTWYAGSTRWRIETKSESPNQPPFEKITVADGEAQWDYNVTDRTVNVQRAEESGFPAPSVLSLDLLREDMSNCYDPKVMGEETIAGRAAFKVYLGPAKCRSAAIWWLNGPHTIWIDKETYFVLKSEIRAENSDQISSKVEVTEIKYNLDFPNNLFTFTPPADAKINDMRPKPAPNSSQYETQLQALTRDAEFPIFAPASLPNHFVPLAPKWNGIERQVELAYVPADRVNAAELADQFGILIYERRADYDLVRNWTDGAQEIEVDGNQAWVRRADFDSASGLGSNSAVIVLRDGTFISISSFRIAPEQLGDVAKSLERVPGSHAPLPNPKPLTLKELRAQSDFPISIPAYVPEGLMPAPPTSNQIEYYRADGTNALIVQFAKQGQGGMEQDARFNGETVKLSNGRDVHQLTFEPEIVILWWDENGGYSALEGHGIARDEMRKIAASMSSTAELGQTKSPPAPPTPTRVPAPAFKILRPTWLPEKMTITERNVPAPNGQGAGIEIRFDPRPNDAPHDALTLTEMPQEFYESDSDSRAVRQNIGGREVTIVRIGEGCVTYHWIQNDAALLLTNPYDPPGAPGQVRYGCEVMERIIASIQ